MQTVWRRWPAIVGVALVAALAIGVLAWVFRPSPAPEPRPRAYHDVTACLLTDSNAVAGQAAARAFGRRLAFVTAAVFLLSVAAPAGAVPSNGKFPLAFLADLFGPRSAWASAYISTPPQPHGTARGEGSYLPAHLMTGNAGAGRAPHKVAGGLDGYQPHVPSATQTATIQGQGFNASTSRHGNA